MTAETSRFARTDGSMLALASAFVTGDFGSAPELTSALFTSPHRQRIVTALEGALRDPAIGGAEDPSVPAGNGVSARVGIRRPLETPWGWQQADDVRNTLAGAGMSLVEPPSAPLPVR